MFLSVTDPVGQGIVASLAHPGSNITGFQVFEISLGTKWMEALKQIAPNIKRVTTIFNPRTAPYAGNVEASLHECRELEISNQGVFQGNAAVAVAEIRGRFEGDLVVRKRLVIRSTGRISGSITYGEIEIESGAEVAGILMPGKENGMKLLLPAFAKRQASASVDE